VNLFVIPHGDYKRLIAVKAWFVSHLCFPFLVIVVPVNGENHSTCIVCMCIFISHTYCTYHVVRVQYQVVPGSWTPKYIEKISGMALLLLGVCAGRSSR